MSSLDVVGVEDANGVGNQVRARVFGMLWLVGDGPAGVAVVVADHEPAAIGEHLAEALLPPEHRPPDAHDEQDRWISEVAKGLRAELDTTHGDHALRQLHPPLGLLGAPSASPRSRVSSLARQRTACQPESLNVEQVFAVNVNVFWTTPATEDSDPRALNHEGRLLSLFTRRQAP